MHRRAPRVLRGGARAFRRRLGLWTGLLGAPVVWLVTAELTRNRPHGHCATDVLHLLAVVAIAGAGLLAWRPCFWNGRYPTLPEFDPLWREFEELGLVLAMHARAVSTASTRSWS